MSRARSVHDHSLAHGEARISVDEWQEWPGKSEAAVALTFDVDAECGLLAESPAYARRLTSLSEARFGVVRGVKRILDVLDEFGVRSTFYVPGDTAERHADVVREVVDRGHELGHHGHMHLRSDSIDRETQRKELERGLEILGPFCQNRRMGYRSPSWELTPETFSLLIELGFAYDSSAMGDDRPYYEVCGRDQILELPVHWSLDDWPYFAWSVEAGGRLADPDEVLRVWIKEYVNARSERRLVTYTMHPEIIGRGYRIGILRALIRHIQDDGQVWFATHGDVALQLCGTRP